MNSLHEVKYEDNPLCDYELVSNYGYPIISIIYGVISSGTFPTSCFRVVPEPRIHSGGVGLKIYHLSLQMVR